MDEPCRLERGCVSMATGWELDAPIRANYTGGRFATDGAKNRLICFAMST
jgi:hypothetical protein